MPRITSLERIDFKVIRNQNEARIRSMLLDVLDEFSDYTPNAIDIEDIYALTLNKLPARYTQNDSFPFEEMVTDNLIKESLRKSIKIVSKAPSISFDENELSLDQLS